MIDEGKMEVLRAQMDYAGVDNAAQKFMEEIFNEVRDLSVMVDKLNKKQTIPQRLSEMGKLRWPSLNEEERNGISAQMDEEIKDVGTRAIVKEINKELDELAAPTEQETPVCTLITSSFSYELKVPGKESFYFTGSGAAERFEELYKEKGFVVRKVENL